MQGEKALTREQMIPFAKKDGRIIFLRPSYCLYAIRNDWLVSIATNHQV